MKSHSVLQEIFQITPDRRLSLSNEYLASLGLSLEALLKRSNGLTNKRIKPAFHLFVKGRARLPCQRALPGVPMRPRIARKGSSASD